MRVFIDTNILIDFVVNREGFSEDADKLFALGITGDIKLMTSALSYVTAMYIAHKYEYQDVKETLLAVSNFVDVLDLQEQRKPWNGSAMTSSARSSNSKRVSLSTGIRPPSISMRI